MWDDNGIIIWQVGTRAVDDDTVDAIIRGKNKSIYTADGCIDANDSGSPDWT